MEFTVVLMAILGILIGIILFVFICLFLFRYVPVWINARSSGVKIGLLNLLAIDLRGINSRVILDALIRATQAGVMLHRNDLEAHYLAGGDVINLTTALIEADKAQISLPFEQAAAVDLAGRDVFEAVKISINPKVIDCPDPRSGLQTIDAVAKDGIQLKARARVTVRANINKLVGGATEETITARVGEGIVTSIGSAENHKIVLENPDIITKKVLEKGLDSGTAFEILSIDVADIDVGDNIGAKLQTDQAEADKKVAQAKAEERRAMAIAQEQEMKARVKQNQAQVVLAEAEVPKAIAEAFRRGNIS